MDHKAEDCRLQQPSDTVYQITPSRKSRGVIGGEQDWRGIRARERRRRAECSREEGRRLSVVVSYRGVCLQTPASAASARRSSVMQAVL